jgi:hypothetical protein
MGCKNLSWKLIYNNNHFIIASRAYLQQNRPYCNSIDNKTKDIIIINTIVLFKTFCNKPDLVPINITIRFYFTIANGRPTTKPDLWVTIVLCMVSLIHFVGESLVVGRYKRPLSTSFEAITWICHRWVILQYLNISDTIITLVVRLYLN